MFCEKKKNLSVRRKIFKVCRGKNVSVEFRVFGKKMKEKYRERKVKVFLGENLKCGILLSSCSLVGLYVNLQVKVTEKKNFQRFFGPGFVSYTRLGAML